MAWLARLSILLAGLLALTLCRGARAQTAQPVELRSSLPTDATLQRTIVAELAEDSHLDAAAIRVTSINGIVELRGTVGTLVAKARAARIAAVVRGARVVVNRIQTILTSRRDADVGRDVRKALKNEPATAKMPISVRTKSGVVTLTGSISSWTEQELAERVADSVPGVRFCVNSLTSRGAPSRTDEMIAADVLSRLRWEPMLSRSAPKVVVKGAVVSLIGTAAGTAARRRAVASGWVTGVRAVDGSGLAIRPDDRLREHALTDLELREAIQDAVAYYFRARPPNITVRVLGGVATLAGVAETYSDEQALEALARSAVGVNEVLSDVRGSWWKPPQPAPQPTSRAARQRPAPSKLQRRGRP